MTHCQMIQTGEIQAVVGDAERDGPNGRQYCGLWSLTSKHRVFNAFGNSFAGLIPSHIRRKEPALEIVDEAAIGLTRHADELYPVDVRAEYRVTAPYYIDHALSFTDHADVRFRGCDFREVTWCSYINCPEDLRLHFRSQGEWWRYISPKHGVGSNIAPGYVADEELEVWPEVAPNRPFYWDRIKRRFDQPFYYGRCGNMVLIFIFDDPRRLRFYCSPDGGGGSLLSEKTCPAWDFMWVIPSREYELGREYKFRMRLVYKRYVTDDDVLDEVRKAQAELGFETV